MTWRFRPGPIPVVSSMLLALLFAGCEEFSTTQPVVVQIAAVDWPASILVTEVDTLEVHLDNDGADFGLGDFDVTVSSSDEQVFTARSLRSPAEPGVRIEISAVGTGDADVLIGLPEGVALAAEPVAVPVAVHMKWQSIDAGFEHSCGVTYDGIAHCWGGGERFLGDGSTNGSAVPVRVVGALEFGRISAGWGHSCGTLPGGLVLCWGINTTGALGTGNTDDQLTPAVVRFGATFRRLRAGNQHTCGISGIGTAVCWGDNSDGQLGAALAMDTCGPEPCSLSPVLVQSPAELSAGQAPTFRDVSVGDRATCGVSATVGEILCWGDNRYGLLGTQAVPSSDTAMALPESATYEAVSTGRFHACALGPEGAVDCWGTNTFGGLGSPGGEETCDGQPCRLVPTTVASATAFTSVSVGEHTTCALDGDGTAFCWGRGDKGQLGSPAPAVCAGLPCATIPTRVAGERRFSAISVGQRHTCALTMEGSAYCWGEGAQGKLGTGATSDSSEPRRVADPG